MTAHDFTGAPCLDNPLDTLWLSTWPTDHEEAKKGCNTCDHFAACLERLEWTRSKAIDGYSGPSGTWAGQLLNPRKKTGRPRKRAA